MLLLRTSGAGAAMQRCHEPAPSARGFTTFCAQRQWIAKIYFSGELHLCCWALALALCTAVSRRADKEASFCPLKPPCSIDAWMGAVPGWCSGAQCNGTQSSGAQLHGGCRAELGAHRAINIPSAGRAAGALPATVWELTPGALSFSVCVKHFPESKFCYGKPIYHAALPFC